MPLHLDRPVHQSRCPLGAPRGVPSLPRAGRCHNQAEPEGGGVITCAEAWTVPGVRIPWYPASKDAPLRLGRNVHHDSRSLAYPWPRDPAAPRAVAMLHARRIPILDQLKIGSCTGNGEIGCIGTYPLFAALPLAAPLLTEDEALWCHSRRHSSDGRIRY